MKRIAIAAFVAATFAGAAFAGPPAKKADVKKADLVCPVMKSPIKSVDSASGKSVYKGKTYYFCCGGCKPAFDKNPAKYAKADPAPKKKQNTPAKKKPS